MVDGLLWSGLRTHLPVGEPAGRWDSRCQALAAAPEPKDVSCVRATASTLPALRVDGAALIGRTGGKHS